MPVRIVLVVLAPLGRGQGFPSENQMPDLVDALMPGLMDLLIVHGSECRRWQPQLSSSGFANMFFSQVPLPGENGKNTPWCAVAGRIESAGGNYAIGLVCRADDNNGLGQIEIPQKTGWLDVVRIF